MRFNPIRSRRSSVAGALLVALGAGLALPGAASGADCCRWELEIKRKAVLSSEFTAKLYAHFPDSGYAFAGATLDILSDGVTWTSVDLCGPIVGPGSSAGIAVGSHVAGITVGQVHFPPVISADPSNPVLVWCGEFEADCRSPAPYRTVWTETGRYEYFPSALTSSSAPCDVREAKRTFYCGPILIDERWLAAPGVGTLHEVVRDTLVLKPERAGGEFGRRSATRRSTGASPPSSRRRSTSARWSRAPRST